MIRWRKFSFVGGITHKREVKRYALTFHHIQSSLENNYDSFKEIDDGLSELHGQLGEILEDVESAIRTEGRWVI